MQTACGRPRILLVSATTIFGGGEVHYIKLARLLLGHYEVAAIACNPILQQELQSMGICVWHGDASPHTSRFGKYLVVAKALVHAVRDFRPQLVHLNGGPEVFLAAIPKLFRVPILISYHTYTEPTEALHKRLLLNIAARLARKVICVSRAVENNWRSVLGAANTTVISNWINIVPPGRPRRPYDGKRPLSLLYIGRLEQAKGIFDLLEAMKFLDDVHLHIVGDGSCMAKVRQQAAGLPITVHGFRRDVTSFYREADIFVLPSLSEGQSLVLIEAMACGVPCLISDLPAPVETAGNGEFAVTYRTGDPRDLVDKIRSLQKDPARLLALSTNGQDFAMATYSEEHIRPMYLSLVGSIISASTE